MGGQIKPSGTGPRVLVHVFLLADGWHFGTSRQGCTPKRALPGSIQLLGFAGCEKADKQTLPVLLLLLFFNHPGLMLAEKLNHISDRNLGIWAELHVPAVSVEKTWGRGHLGVAHAILKVLGRPHRFTFGGLRVKVVCKRDRLHAV